MIEIINNNKVPKSSADLNSFHGKLEQDNELDVVNTHDLDVFNAASASDVTAMQAAHCNRQPSCDWDWLLHASIKVRQSPTCSQNFCVGQTQKIFSTQLGIYLVALRLGISATRNCSNQVLTFVVCVAGNQ